MYNIKNCLEILRSIDSVKKDVIFVGGVAEMIQGKRESTRDIDICVKNIDGLEKFGEVKQWITSSPVSISGNRAGIENNGLIIDIFIEKELPDYIELHGLKFETINSLITRYERVINKINDPLQIHFKNKMVSGLENLRK